MTEPATKSFEVIKTGLEDLAVAHEVLRAPPDDDEEQAARIRAAISVMRRFYKAFFAEAYGADVDGFGWKEKREAVSAILEAEDSAGDDDVAITKTDVATLFEDLSDALHGDLEFGYTDDTSLVRDFGDEYLRFWTETAFDWFEAAGAPEARSLRQELEDRKQELETSRDR